MSRSKKRKGVASLAQKHFNSNVVAGEYNHQNSSAAKSSMMLKSNEGQSNTYDENLLDQVRTQWQFGDWERLAVLSRGMIEEHPDRAQLALLVGAGCSQMGDSVKALEFIRLAKEWGAGKKLINQVLIAGVHNTLGRAAAIGGHQDQALEHFESAITIGTPGGDAKLLTQARTSEQLGQMGMSNPERCLKVGADNAAAAPAKIPVISQKIEALTDVLKQQETKLETQLNLQADELIRIRKFLETVIKREISNATKQIEAFVGLQSYFATGELPNMNAERHSWPVSPDFELYLIELIELNNYDLIIEFGSGISTVLIARALANMALRRQEKSSVEFISFDHLEQYYQQTLAQLKHAGLDKTVQLRLAPLQDYTAPSGKVHPYYACQDILAEIARRYPAEGLRILVIIDGPPAATGPHARYPAGPIIFSLFKDAKIDLLLDDYIRDDEKEIAKLWQNELEAAQRSFTVSERKLEKDACLIAINPRN
jgi:hypothetical protein